ncbi:MAG TPA: hypothetical protein VG498_19310 [Terriglobales bacterium]|nr:hypothetical protein [Terriglobales bacterium]
MPSKRTLNSKSPLDAAEYRKILATIKRGLRRVKRDVQALQPALNPEPEQPIPWDAEQHPAQANSISVSNLGKA